MVNMLRVAVARDVRSCFPAAAGRRTSPWTIPANTGDNNPQPRVESSGTAKLSEKAKHAVGARPRCDHCRHGGGTGTEMRVWRNTHVRIESEPVAEWFLLEEFPRKRQMPPAHPDEWPRRPAGLRPQRCRPRQQACTFHPAALSPALKRQKRHERNWVKCAHRWIIFLKTQAHINRMIRAMRGRGSSSVSGRENSCFLIYYGFLEMVNICWWIRPPRTTVTFSPYPPSISIDEKSHLFGTLCAFF